MAPAPAALHVVKVEEFLADAASALRGRRPARVVSEVYYATFHAALALLSTAGMEATTHRGTQQLLSLHFVHAGLLPAGSASLFGRLAADRAFADYSVATDVTESDARRAVADAAAILRPMFALLEQRIGPVAELTNAALALDGLKAAATG